MIFKVDYEKAYDSMILFAEISASNVTFHGVWYKMDLMDTWVREIIVVSFLG